MSDLMLHERLKDLVFKYGVDEVERVLAETTIPLSERLKDWKAAFDLQIDTWSEGDPRYHLRFGSKEYDFYIEVTKFTQTPSVKIRWFVDLFEIQLRCEAVGHCIRITPIILTNEGKEFWALQTEAPTQGNSVTYTGIFGFTGPVLSLLEPMKIFRTGRCEVLPIKESVRQSLGEL